MDHGELLRARRLAHGVSQERLARRCATSQAFISRIERGDVSPTIESVQRLLAGLGEQLTPPSVVRLPGALDDDLDLLRDARRQTMEARLTDALAASAFAAELHGLARR